MGIERRAGFFSPNEAKSEIKLKSENFRSAEIHHTFSLFTFHSSLRASRDKYCSFKIAFDFSRNIWYNIMNYYVMRSFHE